MVPIDETEVLKEASRVAKSVKRKQKFIVTGILALFAFNVSLEIEKLFNRWKNFKVIAVKR